MNHNYNSLHLVNTYGAFGSVSKVRNEVVLEGAPRNSNGSARDWSEYEFKAKVGDPRRRPPQVAPYHLRLDWLMWFLPLRVGGHASVRHYELWFLRLVEKLLNGDSEIGPLLRRNPFRDAPPAWVRARLYRYEFTDARTRRRTGKWWNRRLIGDFLPPTKLADFAVDAVPTRSQPGRPPVNGVTDSSEKRVTNERRGRTSQRRSRG
jgi:hypothetical protein